MLVTQQLNSTWLMVCRWFNLPSKYPRLKFLFVGHSKCIYDETIRENYCVCSDGWYGDKCQYNSTANNPCENVKCTGDNTQCFYGGCMYVIFRLIKNSKKINKKLIKNKKITKYKIK